MMALLMKAATPFIVASVMLLAAASLAFMTLAAARGMANDTRAQTIAERDAYWTGEIEKSSADANRRIADQAVRAMQIQTDAAERLRLVEEQFAQKEAQNASLPHGDDRCLGRDRVRLLAR